MATMVREQEGAKVFHYGFLSSRVSGALKEYLDTKQVSEESREVLQHAHALLMDIVTAQKLFGKEKEAVAPSETQLSAFNCALGVIIAHQADFDVKDVQGLSQLLETLHRTLRQLAIQPNGHNLPQADVKKTRMFFKHLAELMLAQLSVAHEEKAPVLI